MSDNYLIRLINRGDYIAIDKGRLIINSASGKPVPSDWLNDYRGGLIRELIALTGLAAYFYGGYNTGFYGKCKSAGVSLQFNSVLNGSPAYCVYNAELKRKRDSKTGKRGDRLPAKQFRPPRKGSFYSFWLSTGLEAPKALSGFHDYMGNLGSLVFLIPEVENERAKKGSLTVCNLSYEQIKKAALGQELAVNSQLSASYHPVKPQLRAPVKETPQSLTPQGLQPVLTTGKNYCGNKVIRESGNTGSTSFASNASNTTPEDQSIDEWLSAYDEPSKIDQNKHR